MTSFRLFVAPSPIPQSMIALEFGPVVTTLQSGQCFLRRTEVRPFGPTDAITTAKTDVEVP